MGAANERAFPAMSVREVREGLAAKQFSAREIAEASLARVRALDGAGRREEIARMLQEGFATAEVDKQARALAEARVDADRLLLATDSALQADGDVLAPAERAEIDALMQELRQLLAQAQDAAAIEAGAKGLASGTEAFAARRMNRGIRQALAGRSVDAL